MYEIFEYVITFKSVINIRNFFLSVLWSRLHAKVKFEKSNFYAQSTDKIKNSDLKYLNWWTVSYWCHTKKAKFGLISWCKTFVERHPFRRISGHLSPNSMETVLFHKISTPGNQVKFRYFMQCDMFDIYKGSQTGTQPGPPQISKIESFATIVNDFQPLFIVVNAPHFNCLRGSWLRPQKFQQSQEGLNYSTSLLHFSAHLLGLSVFNCFAFSSQKTKSVLK